MILSDIQSPVDPFEGRLGKTDHVSIVIVVNLLSFVKLNCYLLPEKSLVWFIMKKYVCNKNFVWIFTVKYRGHEIYLIPLTESGKTSNSLVRILRNL